MARDSGGTYSLYTPGNPVVSGTIISSSWANNTLNDLATAMTDSLARSGQGGMLAPLKLFAGTIGAPGLSWTAETTSGLYRAGAGDFRWAIGGVDIWTITGTGVSMGFADGSVGSPSIYFAQDTNTGIYRTGADALAFTVGGVQVGRFETTFTRIIQPILGNDGAVGAPFYSFINDPDTGMFGNGTNQIRFSGGGVLGFIVDGGHAYLQDGLVGTPGLAFASDTDSGLFRAGANDIRLVSGGAATIVSIATGVNTLAVDGATGSPAYTFFADTDTGMWRVGANRLALSVGGAALFDLSATFLDINTVPLRLQNGTVGAPALTFSGDPDVGIYYIAADQFGFATNGVLRLDIRNSGLVMNTGTVLFVQDGLVGTPGFAFAADADTGIYRVGANVLGIASNGTFVASFNTGEIRLDSPLLRANGIHNGTAPTGSANQYIASGTYSPTISNTSGVAASTTRVCQWMRVGNVVTVSGSVEIDPSAATVTFELSLPVASNFAATNQLGGILVFNYGPPQDFGMIRASPANDTAACAAFVAGTANTDVPFTFTYVVI